MCYCMYMYDVCVICIYLRVLMSNTYMLWGFFLRLVCPLFPGSVDCPFLVCVFFSSSCVPFVSGFCGLSVLGLWFCFVFLRLVCPLFPGSVHCPFLVCVFLLFPSSCVPFLAGFCALSFLVALSVFSNVYL